MVRLKMAIAAGAAGVLASGLAITPAASADTAQVVYAWGDNQFNQAGVDPHIVGDRVLSPVPVHGAAARGLRGDGVDRGNTSLPVPTPVTTVSGVTQIAMSWGTILVQARAVIMPGVVGELGVSALGQLRALGLSVQELSVPDPDRQCPDVGLVESQNPPPGTVVGPGTHVTIRVYVTAQGGCF
jgi:hypothetical protein